MWLPINNKHTGFAAHDYLSQRIKNVFSARKRLHIQKVKQASPQMPQPEKKIKVPWYVSRVAQQGPAERQKGVSRCVCRSENRPNLPFDCRIVT